MQRCARFATNLFRSFSRRNIIERTMDAACRSRTAITKHARCAVKVEYLGCGTLGTLSSRSSSLDVSPLTTSCSPSTQRKSFRRSFLRIKDTDRSITIARSLHHRYDALIPQTVARVFLLSLGRAVRGKADERIKLIGRTSPP